MRRFTWLAAIATIAVCSSILPAVSDASAAEIVYENGFEANADGWYPFGAAMVERTNTNAHTGAFSLRASGRNANYEGPALSVTPMLAPGETYDFSAWVYTPITATVGLTMKSTVGGSDSYGGVGAVTTDGAGWVELTGTFTTDPGATALDIYFESGTPSDPFTDIYVDDVTITGEPMTDVVLVTDFDDGTTQGWYGRGAALAAATTDASRSPDYGLAISGRSATWQGPGLGVTDVLDPGAEYAVSAWVQLPPGSEQTSFNLAMVRTDGGAQNFEWISGYVAGVAGDWVELAGTYVYDAAESLELYVEADTLTDFVLDDVTIEQLSLPPGPVGVRLSSDFEAGLDGWEARVADATPPTVSLSGDAHESTQAALVSSRDGQGDGIGHDVTEAMPTGGNYRIEAWVKMADGAGGDIWLTMQRTNDGADSFDTIGQYSGVTSGEWVHIDETYRMAAADAAFLYFETAYPDGTSDSFLVDDVVITGLEDAEIQTDLTPIKETVDFGMGVAIDSRETTGPAAQLTDLHFDQITPENHMKPEAWYDADRNFRVHPETVAMMDFASANDLRVYGHVLVWHGQTPAWFFQRDDGTDLTSAPADQEILRQRMRTHIFSVAEALAAWGEYGGDNPLVAWDVVNEVVSDGATDDGLRRSRWYDVLGESYIDLAFQYAEEAFNQAYAAAGVVRPVALAINDYNTEQGAKRARMKALTERLLERGAPVDIFGHQFHLNLSVPTQALEDAIADIEPLGLQQVVSELDVTTGTPVTEALLIEQGYYYRDAFDIFRAHPDLFSVTVWGLTDDRSWRAANGDPLVFDEDYQAKPAYYGIVGEELPAQQRTAFVFQPASATADLGVASPVWQRLPLHPVGDDASFQLRWLGESLVAYVEVSDPSADPTDTVTFAFDGSNVDVGRDGSGDLAADAIEIVETSSGWQLVATLDLPGAVEGDTLGFDVRVNDGSTTTSWNTPGTLGTLSLVEPLSYTEAAAADTVPTVDGSIEPVWADAMTVSTDKIVEGSANGATAEVSTLWGGDTLYVLAEVTDATPDVSGSDPWVQDSVEIFLDAGNAKNGPYRYDDTQVRINSGNVVSFGAGDEVFQAGRLESATTITETGYVVEAAISLLEYGGPGTYHGVDFQVNDGVDGSRTSVRTWADPTGTGYQTTSRWGVVRLAEPPPCQPVEADQPNLVLPAGDWCVEPGSTVRGSVVVTAGASLAVEGATIKGGVVAVGAGPVTIVDSTVHGAVSLLGGGGAISITGSEIYGQVTLLDNENSDGIIVGGNDIRGGLTCLRNAPSPDDGGTPNSIRGAATGQCRLLG